jgi:hypothetical protein
MANKVADRRKEKEKREKIFLGIGAVLLVGILAIQAPKLMGKKSAKPAAATTSTIVTGGVTGGLTGSTGSLPANGRLAAPAESFAAGPGQLTNLGLFAQKDPFRQHGGSRTPTGSSTATSPVPPTTTGRTTKTRTSPTGTTPTATRPAPLYVSAVISVNGASEGVNVSQAFPAASPVFVLRSVARSSIVIGIAGGQFSSGQPGLTIKTGQSVTLVNTADGARYVVSLISVSTKVAELPQATGTTDTASSIPPSPTAPTTIAGTGTSGTTTDSTTGAG